MSPSFGFSSLAIAIIASHQQGHLQVDARTHPTMPSTSKTSFRSLARRVLPGAMAVFLALAWLLPNHESPWLSFHAEMIATVGGACLALFACISGWGKPIRLPIAALVLLVVAAVPWIQWLTGLISFFGDALLVSAYLAGTAVCLWAGHRTFTHDGRSLVRSLAYAMLWSAIASTGIALYQWFGLTGLDIWARDGVPGARAIGNLTQPNHLATLLMFGLASAAWLHAERKLRTAVTVLAGAFLVLGVALTASRTPWLGLFLFGAWCAWSESGRSVSPSQRWLAGALLLWLGLTYWAVQYLPVPLHLAADGLGQDRLQPGLRPLLWSQFARSLSDAPWLGYGWQGGLTAQATAALLRPGLEISAYAHNIALDLLTWNGVPLGVLLASLLAAWYFRVGMYVRKRGAWFQFAIVTFFLAHALVEYPHAYVYFLVPVALLAGQLEAQRGSTTLRWPRWFMPTVAAMTGTAAIFIVVDYLQLADDRREVMLWLAKVGPERDLPAPPQTRVLDQLAASARWARIVPTPGMTEGQMNEQIIVSRRFASPFLLHQTVLMLALNGRPDAALTELHRLRALFGERSYRATVAELRELAGHTQPALKEMIALIDSTAPLLPPLPNYSVEMGVRGM